MYIFLREGRAYVLSAEEAFTSKYYLASGDRIASFEPADLSNLRLPDDSLLADGAFRNGTDGWVVEADHPDTVRFGTNLGEDWRLDDTAVAFIEAPSHPGTLRLLPKGRDGSTRLPVIGGSPFRFTALSACHRCVADLSVSFLAADGSTLAVARDTLPIAHGGRKRDDYHRVELALVAPQEAVQAEVAISYDRPFQPVPGYASFMFLADVSVTLPDCRFETAESLRPFEACLGVEAGTRPPSLYSAPIDVAHVSSHHFDIVVRSTTGDIVATPLRFAEISVPSRAGIEQLDAGVFAVSMSQPFDYTLFIDERRIPAHQYFEVGLGSGRLQLVSDLLDGEFHRVAVRDATGCITICETYALLPFQQTPWAALQEHDGVFPSAHLSPVAGHRYKSLLAHLRRHANANGAATSARLAQIERAHDVLSKGFDHNRDFTPLVFSAHADPQVSIVIPVHDKFEVTYFCLCALLFAYTDVAFEVIVVDDGSSDRTIELPDVATNVVYVRNECALGFVRACNKGAEAARGAYVLFLNNDTEPTYRWLDELVGSFSIFNRVGLAGSKLLYPDGRLQDAGGIVWRNGNPWNYGRSGNAFDPRFCYTRQADYLSGASLILPMSVWREVGGFSDEFAPAYFEDTDLAFKVREAGYKTLMVATSVVYHFEGVTGGTDVTSGTKRHQEINRPKFKRKWGSVFRSHREEGARPDLEKDRGVIGRALFLDYQTPRPDVDAGSYAARQEMKLIQRLGYKVTFFPTNCAYLPNYFEALQREGVEMLHAPFFTSAADVLERRGREFEIIYITRYYVAAEVLDAVRRHAPQAKILFCNADLHFLRQLRSAVLNGSASAIEEAVKVRDDELSVMRRVDVTLSYNEVEHAVILSHNLASGRVMKLPWVETVRDSDQPFAARDGVAFLGGFNHHPNVEAVEFFADKIVPGLAQAVPGTVFHIYGSNMPKAILDLASAHVVPHGFVADLDEVFARFKVFVAPLLSGAGIKGKVLAALARGVPCVLSPVAAEGIGLRHGYDCMIAETPEEWTAAIAELVGNADLWSKIAARGKNLIRDRYSDEKGLLAMRRIVESVDLQVM